MIGPENCHDYSTVLPVKYKESIACVLGNSFSYGDDAQKGKVRTTSQKS